MRIKKIAASKSTARRRVMAETEVAPEATELLFETEDVAEILAEATGEDVVAEATEDGVEFTVGEEVFTAEPEGDEEILEASTRISRIKKPVKASARAARKSTRTVRRAR